MPSEVNQQAARELLRQCLRDVQAEETDAGLMIGFRAADALLRRFTKALEALGPIAVDQAMIDRATRTCVTGRIYSPPVTDDEWRTALTAALRPTPSDSGEK